MPPKFKKIIKRYIRRIKKRNVIMKIPKSSPISGFPNSLRTKLKLGSNFGNAMGQNGLVSSSTIFNVLNIQGISGIPPTGWQTLKNVYDQFFIHGVKVKMTYHNTGYNFPCQCYLVAYDIDINTTLAGSPQLWPGMPYAVVKTVNAANSGDKLSCVNKMYISTKKILGYKEIPPQNSYGYTGSPNSAYSYAQQDSDYCFEILAGIQSITGATFPAANGIAIQYEFTYYIEFRQRLNNY